MNLTFNPEQAVRILRKADSSLGRLMARVGPLGLSPPRRFSPFQYLLRSIIYQQLSGKAAETIYGRVRALYPGRRTLHPAQILDTSDEALRGAGLSWAKVAAAKNLAARDRAGEVPSGARLREMTDEDIVAHLTQVKGIGEWTVQMLLIFQMGRPDVLPMKDLGVRKGFMRTYALDDLPLEREMATYCECWRPYRSVGSWYMWRSLEIEG